MYIVPGLWAVFPLLLAGLVGLFAVAIRRGWMHWERCTPAALSLSHLVNPALLMAYRIFVGLYCFSLLLWLVARERGQYAFYFYTVWNYTFLTAYFLVRAHWVGPPKRAPLVEPRTHPPPCWSTPYSAPCGV